MRRRPQDSTPSRKNNRNRSRQSAILNAHKPLPLSELMSNASTDTTSDRQKKDFLRLIISILFVGLFALIIWWRRRISTAWMLHPVVQDLLQNTPRTKDQSYTLFCTKSDGDTTHTAYATSNKSPSAALRSACARASKDPSATWIQVHSVTSVQLHDNFNYDQEIIPPLTGFALGDWSNMVFLYEHVQASALTDKRGKLRFDNIGKLWAHRHKHKKLLALRKNAQINTAPWPDMNLEDTTCPIEFIVAESVFFNKDTDEAYPLFKGRRILQTTDLTPALLYNSAQLAGQYLAGQVNVSTGIMAYRYRPRSDTQPTDEYNFARHAGTAYAMADLYSSFRNPKLLEAIKKAIDYIKDNLLVDCPLAYQPDETAKCVVNEVRNERWSQLGTNALTLLAMVQYMQATGDKDRYWESSVALANYIKGAQRRDGSFLHGHDIDTNQLDEDAYVRYYPGSAAFAMARLHNVATAVGLTLPEGDKWKSVARKAIDYTVERDAEITDEDFVNDHWMMYAAAEMAPWHWTKDVEAFVIRTGKVAEDRQIRKHDTVDRDHDGIYVRPGTDKNGEDLQSLSTYGTATKSEGLCAIYPILLKHSPAEADRILESVKYGIKYQLETQFRPELAMHMKMPKKILGAFAKNILETETRNDYSQHNLSSLLCLARILEQQSLETKS